MAVRHWTYRLLTSKRAKSYADLALVKDDLKQVTWCCREVVKSGDHPLTSKLSQSLFDSAVVRYRRCFNNGRRTRLDKLRGDLSSDEQKTHDFILALGDKHTAHSWNEFESGLTKIYFHVNDDKSLVRGSIGGGSHRTLGISLADLTTIADLADNLLDLVAQWMDKIKKGLDEEVAAMTDAEILALPDDYPPADLDVTKDRTWPLPKS